jgi:hypothetical protein
MQVAQMMPCSRYQLAPATDLKSAFGYHAVFDTTAKIQFALSVPIPGKADSEWLFRLQRHKKLDSGYGGKLTTLAPRSQSRKDFVKDYYARDQRRTRKMPGQAGMISTDRAANFKIHAEVSVIVIDPATCRGSRLMTAA